jgi:hypothetical protein
LKWRMDAVVKVFTTRRVLSGMQENARIGRLCIGYHYMQGRGGSYTANNKGVPWREIVVQS